MGAVVNNETETAPPPSTVRVLLVDDEALMRSGLRLMIDGAQGIEVVGEAADGLAALAQARALAPDVILMDIRMPRMTGLEALRELRAADVPARVVMLTAFDTEEFLLEALRAGAMSFLLKDSPPQDVVAAVLDAAAERPRFSPDVLSRLVRLAADGGGDGGNSGGGGAGGAGVNSGGDGGDSGGGGAGGGGVNSGGGAAGGPAEASGPEAAPSAPEGVTDREWEVARAVAGGLSNHEIAEQLFMSVATVKTHLGRLYHKLQVTNRVQLAIQVFERDT